MAAQFGVNQLNVDHLLALIQMGSIAIPEIQRPFVWDATKVRNLMDSLYKGYPVGYIIAWQNPSVKLKDGSTAAGKRVLIDGQQRVTALMAALLGREVVAKDYRKRRIVIAFHPIDERFEVSGPFIEKDSAWVPDISKLFGGDVELFEVVSSYVERNPAASAPLIFKRLSQLMNIQSLPLGVIDLAPHLDIETVTEIFIRVNSAGVSLSQADFAMSKIAVDENNGGNSLRKAIEYFCHLAVAPDAIGTIRNDSDFVSSGMLNQIEWMTKNTDTLFDPSYIDVLRVIFTSEFKRGRLADLVALLSGRNFETKTFEESVIVDTFSRLRQSFARFANQYDYDQYLLILRSTGFIDPSLITSKNVIDFGYILYLLLKEQGFNHQTRQPYVRRWLVMSALTGRYSAAPESRFDQDSRRIADDGLDYIQAVLDSELSESYWTGVLPMQLMTSVISSPQFRLYQAAQVKLGDRGFLSDAMTVGSLITVHSDVHHIFPRHYLSQKGVARGQYNQIANYVVTQSEINIRIGSTAPDIYFTRLADQVSGGPMGYGNITDEGDLRENFRQNAIPEDMHVNPITDYQTFLQVRRGLMAAKLRKYYESL